MPENRTTRRRPPINPEARESRMVAKAMDLAERQLEEGTASAQVITHFLKLATQREELEKEKLRIENKKIEAQIKSIESAEETKVLYENAIRAMKSYTGCGDDEEYEYDDY